jgi:hypothetical protein
MAEYKRCEYCGGRIGLLYVSRQRFCSVECGNAWFGLERRQAVEWFRAQGIEVVVPAPKADEAAEWDQPKRAQAR